MSIDVPVGPGVVVTDVFDASLIDILNRRGLQVDHRAIRTLAFLSTLAHSSVPPQVRTPLPAPSNRRCSPVMYP